MSVLAAHRVNVTLASILVAISDFVSSHLFVGTEHDRKCRKETVLPCTWFDFGPASIVHHAGSIYVSFPKDLGPARIVP